ncbi:alpha/beta fold hydrolase [Cystobacter fuscus]
MRRVVEWTQLPGEGPRVLMLPGLGARGAGFQALARRLQHVARPLLVEYPEGPHAARGAGALAQEVFEACGPVDAVVASSFGGMVAAHRPRRAPRGAWPSWAPSPAPSTWARGAGSSR